MSSIQYTLFTLALVSITGCSPNPVTGDAAVTPDQPTVVIDGMGSSCAEPPHPNPGTMVGTDFANVTMPYCDDTQFNFYQNGFCDNRLTVIILSAGWCAPCQAEAQNLQAMIVDTYAGRVRVVTVYGQNVNRSAPTAAECMAWKTRYRLNTHMVYDPMGVMQQVFPNQAYPSTLIVDRNGRIQAREYGTSQGLAGLRMELDRLLQ